MSAALRHRGDIDGLRAAAILPILLFHAGISALSGGFIGVDIFFVISGFLITSIIVREAGDGRFRLLEFYRRRVVRIFPALIAMVAIVLIVGAWRLLPAEFDRLAHSAMAALAFASNIHFWLIADYFAPEAELMPLLHTWSLGVEEQYYILFPVMMILLLRYSKGRLTHVLSVLAAGSFLLGMVAANHSPVAAFYLLPVRAWELLVGAVVATSGVAASLRHRPSARAGLAALGALLLAAAIVVVRDGPLFPMPLALAPVVGTALLIAFAEGTPIGRGLSAGPMRYIGRISYSTYLWHWPIIAFWRIETGAELRTLETMGLVAASLVAGAVSYRVIERPVLDRYRSQGASGRIVAIGLGAIIALIAAAAVLQGTANRWRKIDPAVQRIAAYEDYLSRPEYQYQFRRGPCFRGEAQAALAFDPADCVALSSDQPNIVVVGDSYAAQYWRAIALRLPGKNVMQATASGCRPLTGSGGEARCREVADYVLGPLLQTGRVEAVVLAGRWVEQDLPHLAPTIARIRSAGAVPIVVGPVPEYSGAFPAILARASARHDLSLIDQWRKPDRFALDPVMERIVVAAGGEYRSAVRALCPDGRCMLTTPDGTPVQFDYGHLTLAGARLTVSGMAFP